MKTRLLNLSQRWHHGQLLVMMVVVVWLLMSTVTPRRITTTSTQHHLHPLWMSRQPGICIVKRSDRTKPLRLSDIGLLSSHGAGDKLSASKTNEAYCLPMELVTNSLPAKRMTFSVPVPPARTLFRFACLQVQTTGAARSATCLSSWSWWLTLGVAWAADIP